MFSLNRKLKSKDVSIAPKYNDASQRTKMLAINAQKPKKSMHEISYKNVNTTYSDAKRALNLIRR